MEATWEYLKYLARHKLFCLVECFKMGIYWQGITHDLSKFRPSEFGPYRASFYGSKYPSLFESYGEERNILINTRHYKEKVEEAFDRAWLYHQHRSPHHWQFWLLYEDDPKSHWTVQAYQPEVGPYYLAYDNVRIANFTLDGEDDYSKNNFLNVLRVEQALLESNTKVLDMPMKCRKEMLADWKSVGRTLGKPDTKTWYLNNRDKMILHPNTREWIEEELKVKQ